MLPRCLVPALALALTPLARAQCGHTWLPSTAVAGVDSNVYAAASWDPDGPGPLGAVLVAGGFLTNAGGAPAAHIARWDPATDSWAPLGSGVDSLVVALAPLPNGELAAGGVFATAGGVAVNGVARWNGSSWQAYGTGFNSIDVRALAVLPNGDLVAGGSFTAAGGVAVNHVAQWNGNAWQPIGAGLSGIVNALTVAANGDIIAAGVLPQPGPGVLASGFVERWNGSVWTRIGTSVMAGQPSSIEAVVELPGGDLAVGGLLSSIDGVTAHKVARFDGVNWSAVGGIVHGTVHALLVHSGGDLIAATHMSSPLGSVQGVLAFDGTSWNAITPGTAGESGTIEALAELPGGLLIAGGSFGGRSIAGYDGTRWQALGAGLDQSVDVILRRRNGDVLVGGRLTGGIRRFDAGTFHELGLGLDDAATALVELPNGDLVAGGWFEAADASPAAHVARWDGAVWTPLGLGVDGAVEALAVAANGDLVVGGRFFHAGGIAAEGLALWNGQTWSSPGLNYGRVTALLAQPNGDVLATAGALTSTLLQWDGTSWQEHPLPIPVLIRTMTRLHDGRVACGFSGILQGGGGVLLWDGTSFAGMVGVNGSVDSILELPGNDLLIGGAFVTLGGQPRANLVRWNGTFAEFAGGTAYDVESLAFVPEIGLLVGGRLQQVGGNTPSPWLAQLTSTCPAATTSLPTTCVGTQGPVTLVADTVPWAGTLFRSTATGFAPNALAAALVGFTSPNVPLTWLWPNTLPGCDQLASHDAVVLALPQNGTSRYFIGIPPGTALVGLSLYHQFLQLEVTAQNQLGQLSASNGLQVAVGAF
ncbi:MAG: hypothetical protein KDE27_32190 [Planctomycetes bacterium]|nr:hypothetical protein [Planctomycetota bacterium]